MKISELFESPPETTFPTDFGLEDLQHNHDMAKTWLKDKRKKPIDSFEGGTYTLYEMPRAFLLVNHQDKNNPEISYAMEYKVVFHKFIGRQAAQQIAVWSNPADTVNDGMAKKIFFDHLLQNYKTVITDAKQTPDGKRFWFRRISEAITLNGFYVYYVNLLPKREITQITTTRQLAEIANDEAIWGDVQKHQARRLIITTTPMQ